MLVVPQDDNQLLIYAATQNNAFLQVFSSFLPLPLPLPLLHSPSSLSPPHPLSLQAVVSEATGLPMNKITIVVKQLGGGYGAKIIKPNQIAAAAAVAALKFRRPVKVVMDLNTNFEMIGIREREVKGRERERERVSEVRWGYRDHETESQCSGASSFYS